MTSIATLGYGLTVRATDVLTAAQAWPHLEPTFRFFDLLFLRKRNETLASRGNLQGLIEKVPIEVWEEIRKGVVRRELIDAEDRFLGQFSYPCEGLAGCRCSIMEETSWDYLRRHGFPDYLWRSNQFLDKIEDLKHGDDAGVSEAIRKVVTAFGVSHPLNRFVTLHPQKYWNLDDVALITIPAQARRDDTAHPGISAEAGFEQQDEHTLVNVSLDLPSGANLRFIRFIRTFDLQVVEVSKSTLRCVAPDSETKSNSRKGLAGIKKDEVKNV
ncbi:uncharacterized protein JCM6883_004442, partial [Sporobolomyces salmoneus]|uniref:uncharacterized protein n=1 Tax=Sporobolomyces salmoneus TaxID=183962 RepID=UPI003180799F